MPSSRLPPQLLLWCSPAAICRDSCIGVGPLTAPETVINTFDALAPQRVSGALDYTAWPSVLPTQSEAWSGSDRFDVRRDGVELFCKFQVTDIKAETVAAGKTYTMAEKDGYPSWSVASEPKQTPTVTVTAEDVEQCVKLTWTCELDETGSSASMRR